MWTYNHTDELYHHGIKGMKWGVRRYQNKDGTLTPAGKKREAAKNSSSRDSKTAYNDAKKNYKDARKAYNKSFNNAYNKSIAAYSPIKKHREANDKRWEDAVDKAIALNKAKSEYKQAKKQYKMDEKMAKQEYKDFVKTRSKEILAGESFAGKAWDLLTDGHKYQAQIEYNLRDKDKK